MHFYVENGLICLVSAQPTAYPWIKIVFSFVLSQIVEPRSQFGSVGSICKIYIRFCKGRMENGPFPIEAFRSKCTIVMFSKAHWTFVGFLTIGMYSIIYIEKNMIISTKSSMKASSNEKTFEIYCRRWMDVIAHCWFNWVKNYSPIYWNRLCYRFLAVRYGECLF